MTTDPIVDLVDPIRLLISLLPPTWQAPAAVIVSTLASLVTVASLITARLPLSARQHPRYGWAVRLLHRVSLLRLRDELGSTKLPGAEVAPRVTVAPAVLPLVESAGKAGAVAVSETRGFVAVPPTDLAVMGGAKFDPTATITVTPEISAAVRAIDDQRGQRGYASLRALLAVVVLGIVGGSLVMGCPVVREVSLRAARAPSPGDCRPGTMRCLSTPDGVVPVRCAETPALDGRHREWPALPRDGYGDQRYCAWGCIVEDGGTLAHCTGRDGGL